MSWLRPDWVLKFYEGFGSKLQGWADRIEALEFSPEVREALQGLSDALPNYLAIALVKYIEKIYKKLGPEMAQEWVVKLFGILNNFKFSV